MACTYRVKFIEVSVGINHNVDELLAGTLTQIRLKKEHCELQVSDDIEFFVFSHVPYSCIAYLGTKRKHA